MDHTKAAYAISIRGEHADHENIWHVISG